MQNKDLKIYTRKGDLGETSLLGGKRVSKADPRIDIYGTIDELNSFTGLIRDFAIEADIRKALFEIQCTLFVAEALMACPTQNESAGLPAIAASDTDFLEMEIDRMSENLLPLSNFILPGGHPLISYCHVARTVCRRAERLAVALPPTREDEKMVVKYLNRLSDYFFILARYIARELKVEEVKWAVR